MEIKVIITLICVSVFSLLSCDYENQSVESVAISEKKMAQLNKLPVNSMRTASNIVNGLVATHCTDNEIVYMNAIIQQQGLSFSVPNRAQISKNKLLSICLADDKTRLVYKYGAIGDIEYSIGADQNNPFAYYIRERDNFSENVLFFSQHDYRFYVVYNENFESGVAVKVYQGEQLISELASGNEAYQDYVVATTVDIPSALLFKMTPPNTEMR